MTNCSAKKSNDLTVFIQRELISSAQNELADQCQFEKFCFKAWETSKRALGKVMDT